MTVSKTLSIGAKESTKAKAKRRYKKNSYICNPNRLPDIVIQSVTSAKTTSQSQESK